MSHTVDFRSKLISVPGSDDMEEIFQVKLKIKNAQEYPDGHNVDSVLSSACIDVVSYVSLEMALAIAIRAVDELMEELKILQALAVCKSHEENDRNNP